MLLFFGPFQSEEVFVLMNSSAHAVLYIGKNIQLRLVQEVGVRHL